MKLSLRWSNGTANEHTLGLVRIEEAEGMPRFVLTGRPGEAPESVVYYAILNDKLILVGNCPRNRPYEGFPLSGEYTRVPGGG